MLTGFAGESHARRPITQRLMRPLLVVEREPAANAPPRLDHRAIRLGKHFFIFEAPPQPIDEDVVQKPPLTVHADAHPRGLQLIHEPGAGSPHTLIGVHNHGILPTTRSLKSPFTNRITPTRASAP